jgi:hypothetical protein
VQNCRAPPRSSPDTRQRVGDERASTCALQTPDAASTEVIQRAESGEHLTHAQVKETVDKAVADARAAEAESDGQRPAPRPDWAPLHCRRKGRCHSPVARWVRFPAPALLGQRARAQRGPRAAAGGELPCAFVAGAFSAASHAATMLGITTPPQ